jgi:hypothetical protein
MMEEIPQLFSYKKGLKLYDDGNDGDGKGKVIAFHVWRGKLY